MADGETQQSSPHEMAYSLDEVAVHLNVTSDALCGLNQRFAHVLSNGADGKAPTYTNADIAALIAVQQLLAQGYTDEQIENYLTPIPDPNEEYDSHEDEPALTSSSSNEEARDGYTPAAEEILNTIISNQQLILNSQTTLRDVVNVVIQDNFSLKDENKKLRERMLELERVMAEYQRREETRKERIEHRLRALEGTVGALQQQLAQLVQIYRNQNKRGGGWFG